MKLAFALICLLFASTTNAQSTRSPQDEAKWLLERLTGVKWPAGSAVLNDITQKIQAGDRAGAAAAATAQPQFLDVVVLEMASKMSTRDESVREPLNDFSATFIGVTRDNTDARELLHGNFFYKGDQTKLTGLNIPDDVVRNNNHYLQMSRANVSLANVLMRVNGQQIANSQTTVVPNPDPAGVLTSRAFMSAHALAGTNRRLVEYTFRQFMCLPINEWADTAASDARVGRDIDRAPGGDPTRYMTTCKGCHTVMDGFRGAFAKWDYRENTGVIVHSASGATNGNYSAQGDANGVVAKMNRPTFIQFDGGYVTTGDSFINNANRPNSVNAMRFGWRQPATDNDAALADRTGGVHAFGRLIAGSRRFSQCMAKRVWDAVCKHELSESEMDAVFIELGFAFEAQSYSLRKLFESAALHPKCRLVGGV